MSYKRGRELKPAREAEPGCGKGADSLMSHSSGKGGLLAAYLDNLNIPLAYGSTCF